MPTVLREEGFEVRIYTLDHPPPHVHVAKAGAIVRIDLATRTVTEIVGTISDRDVRRAPSGHLKLGGDDGVARGGRMNSNSLRSDQKRARPMTPAVDAGLVSHLHVNDASLIPAVWRAPDSVRIQPGIARISRPSSRRLRDSQAPRAAREP